MSVKLGQQCCPKFLVTNEGRKLRPPMRTSFYFERFQRLGDRISDRISDRIKLTETESLIYAEIKRNPSITVPLLMHETGYSEPTINRALKALREKSCIARVGARKNGRWEALK